MNLEKLKHLRTILIKGVSYHIDVNKDERNNILRRVKDMVNKEGQIDD